MSEYVVNKSFSNKGDRNEVRLRVVSQFAMEEAGLGKDELASRYTYFVETCNDGNRVYLRRPANLHNGFDFLVCVEGYNFSEEGKRMRNYPKHEDIIKDLEIKKELESEKYKILYNELEAVYNCEEFNEEIINSLDFDNGFSADMIIKVVKWFFIEQDIRYWNYSGRNMLWSGIPKL